jgi:phage tail protein X
VAGAPQFIPYTTKAGDRWDLLAWRFYGDPTQYSVIIQANPAIPIEAVFEQGLVIGRICRHGSRADTRRSVAEPSKGVCDVRSEQSEQI